MRWVLGETVQGSGATQQVIVMVKPIRGGLRTNIILTTDQRTYLLDAVSYEGDTYTSVISWNYPQEEARERQAAQAAETQGVAASGLAVDALHFGYRIKANGFRAPRWQPVRVFDDGLKTYIQFPATWPRPRPRRFSSSVLTSRPNSSTTAISAATMSWTA